MRAVMVKPRLWRSIRTANLRSAIMSNAQCRMRSRCRMPNAECRIPNAECRMPNLQIEDDDVRSVFADPLLNLKETAARFTAEFCTALPVHCTPLPCSHHLTTFRSETLSSPAARLTFAGRCSAAIQSIVISPNTILHASTSVGANLEEAGAGHTKPDFRNKVSTSRKECREARYWLRLIADPNRSSRHRRRRPSMRRVNS